MREEQFEFASAIVTGGGSGLGRALALELAGAGVDVFVWGRREEPLRGTQGLARDARGTITPVVCDVTDRAQIARALAASSGNGVPGALVNNAAGAYVQLAHKVSPRGWSAVLAASLDGVFNVSQAWCATRVAQAPGGVVLNITSATVEGGSPGTAHSGAAKAGVTSLTKTLAVEWARWGIRVNALAPGAFVTDGGAAQIWADSAIEQRILDAIPMRRFADVDEIVAPATFLLSRGGRYMTGSIVKVDGGWTLNDFLYTTPDHTEDTPWISASPTSA